MQTLTHEIERLRPDVVMVLGDRIEAFAGATAGLFCGGTVAHIHGGEVTQGGLDEYMRHAITKLSHIHFPATAKSRDRILQMGENPDFTYCVGTPGLDALLAFPNLTNQEISKELGITLPDRFALLVQHPVSTQAETAGQDFLATLTALEESSIPTILIYPNADAGSQAMIQLLKEWQHKDWLYPFVNVTRKIFCNLLKRAIVLIGNSSSGMIDAPAYGVPVINIGKRQQGRERGENVIDVPPQKQQIKKALQKVMTDEDFIQQAQNTENPYGDGHAADRIVKTLENVDLKKAQSAKMFRE
ncbi:UDP-N-acetylglucosamine 2-epimerase (hydrolyzing) [bacterium]|nr:UDP-N-acetylglucosamine 2-epimerase (hydrolyzing) [bacterium]